MIHKKHTDTTKVSIENLHLYYGDFHALKGISLDIPQKQVTAFIGPSGCGKSTCLKTINRMNDLVAGCRIEGKISHRRRGYLRSPHRRHPAAQAGRDGIPEAQPFPLSIYDNIAYGPKVHGIKQKSRLDEIVESSLRHAALWDDVKDRLKKSALGLSGGQQQRLCIARALAVEPDILLMDEPTSALDPISTLKIEDLMDDLREKYTVVIVTHNMQQAARIADQTAFFLSGEVVEFSETESMFNNPKDERTERYITGRFG